ncbi:MAG: asparagine synthase (glutamine-hydrolyzing) [Candidatus Wallbacteria bacterium]|nr:asparagine synthase (glutamine-hydrolyzing) [Candidatus Wallbacteria bacterium]
MCGIFGFTHQRDDKHGQLEKMAALQFHRGPDSSGFYHDDSIALGMRRLSIIDPAGGDQPFFSADRQVAVICNGEIYNYLELRDELKTKGYVFHTGSDVEVVPHLYREHGIDFVGLLNGMFAIALYDRLEQKLFLIRDRLGIKPLYYTEKNGDLAFASELKSLLVLDEVSSEPDFIALSSVLETLFISAPHTPFKAIRKLESGSVLCRSRDSLGIRKYWNPVLQPDFSLTEEQALEEIGNLMRDSIRLELRSDVPVGCFLSGGIDSSAIAAFAAMLHPDPLDSFHISWQGVAGKIDESAYASEVAAKYGMRENVKSISDADLLSELPKLIWHLEEPMGDGAFIPTYGLAKMAAQKVKVIFSGAGGDELFGGYFHHKRHSLLKSLAGRLLYNKAPALHSYDVWKDFNMRKWRGLFPWFQPDALRPEFELPWRAYPSSDPVNGLMYSDIQRYLQDDVLLLTDKMTMAASLECRVPLLDHRLVELSLRMPSDLKIKNGSKKYLFRKFLQPTLPDSILNRPKEGFGIPVVDWVNLHRHSKFDHLWQNSFLISRGWLDRCEWQKLLELEHLDASQSWRYWKTMMLELWARIFIGLQSPGGIW